MKFIICYTYYVRENKALFEHDRPIWLSSLIYMKGTSTNEYLVYASQVIINVKDFLILLPSYFVFHRMLKNHSKKTVQPIMSLGSFDFIFLSSVIYLFIYIYFFLPFSRLSLIARSRASPCRDLPNQRSISTIRYCFSQ